MLSSDKVSRGKKRSATSGARSATVEERDPESTGMSTTGKMLTGRHNKRADVNDVSASKRLMIITVRLCRRK